MSDVTRAPGAGVAEGAVDYTYDVFISYNRQRNKSEWLIDHFLPLFEEYLSDEIISQVRRQPRKIFLDQAEVNPSLRQFEQRVTGIEPGAVWQDVLRKAIARSCCMLAVWSPGYFMSKWCLEEWTIFTKREKETQTIAIIPLSVHDGVAFPEEARARNIVDLSDYMIVGEAFRKNQRFVQFQDTLKALAHAVAAAIRNAAPYTPHSNSASVEVPEVPEPKPIGLTTFAAK
jgi:hypothetical protein